MYSWSKFISMSYAVTKIVLAKGFKSFTVFSNCTPLTTGIIKSEIMDSVISLMQFKMF